ncbi:MAG TPA: Asp23/Gls24 family envelope stress response protein [Opitutae bacterium]|nr:Asp23/Gls24 family envelope stress response protein [Opitutae bacterium]|tara:strand:- start:11831 stop:12280 length:450 start_codon:yes stop_codon:yes gene_type:complete
MTRKQKDDNTEDSIPTISEESSELGSIRINHSVVAGIVRLATQSVTGVVNVGGAGVVEGLTDFFSKKESERGVKVSESADGGYNIEVRVVLEFGVDLAKVGVSIQEAIRDQILAMTGNHVKNIDVVIDDIKLEPTDKEADDLQWNEKTT